MIPKAWQLVLGYLVALVLGLALVYFGFLGMISAWFIPVGLLILFGGVFSLAFVLYRIWSGNWPKR